MSQRQAVSDKLKSMKQDDLDAQLLSAFETNDMDNVRLYYNHYANIHTHLNKSIKASVQHQNDDMIEFIMGKAKKMTNYDVQAILTYANAENKTDLAKKVITENRDIFDKENYFYVDLARKGDVSLLKFCHEEGINIRGNDDWILVQAAEAGQLETVKFLIEEVGANPRARDDSAFGAACSAGSVETAKYLKEQGCRTKHKDNYPVWTAAFSGHVDVLHYLKDIGLSMTKTRQKNETPLVVAIQQSKIDAAAFFINQGADLDAHNGAALSTAICANSLDMVKLLIEHGANIHVRDYEWQKENKAVAKLKDVFAKVVLRKTAEDTPKYFDTYSCLTCAARYHHADIFDYLIDQGANIHGNNNQVFNGAMNQYYELERNKAPELKAAQHILNTLIDMAPDVILGREFNGIKSYYIEQAEPDDVLKRFPPAQTDFEQGNILLEAVASDYNWPIAKMLIEKYDVDIDGNDNYLIRQALRDDLTSKTLNKNSEGANREMLRYLVEAGADTSVIEETQPKLLFDFNREEIEDAQKQRAEKQKLAAEQRVVALKENQSKSLKSLGRKKPITMKRRS